MAAVAVRSLPRRPHRDAADDLAPHVPERQFHRLGQVFGTMFEPFFWPKLWTPLSREFSGFAGPVSGALYNKLRQLSAI